MSVLYSADRITSKDCLRTCSSLAWKISLKYDQLAACTNNLKPKCKRKIIVFTSSLISFRVQLCWHLSDCSIAEAIFLPWPGLYWFQEEIQKWIALLQMVPSFSFLFQMRMKYWQSSKKSHFFLETVSQLQNEIIQTYMNFQTCYWSVTESFPSHSPTNFISVLV